MTITMTHPGHDNPAIGRKAAMAAAVAALTVAAYFGVQALTVTEATHTVRPAAALADADFATALQSSVIPRSDFGSDLDWIVANGFASSAPLAAAVVPRADFGSDLDWIIANDFGSVAAAESAVVTETYPNEIEYLNNSNGAPAAVGSTAITDKYSKEIEYLNNSNGAPTVAGCQLSEVKC